MNNKKGCTVFIIEGQRVEMSILEKVKEIFFGEKSMVIPLPAEGTIYSVWNKLTKNEPYDIIEALRETVSEKNKPLFDGIKKNDVAELYLFFDLDIQSFHGKKEDAETTIRELLNYFDDETDHGKLYLSYPMVESFYSWMDGTCRTGKDCVVPTKDIKKYKTNYNSSLKNRYTRISQYNSEIFNKQLNSFLCRVACLYNLNEMPKSKLYWRFCKPSTVYDREEKYLSGNRVFEFSAVPEFLLDYFDDGFWQKHVIYGEINRDGCERHTPQ